MLYLRALPHYFTNGEDKKKYQVFYVYDLVTGS